MIQQPKTRTHIRAEGIIAPGEVCDLQGAKSKWGLTRAQLDEARDSGIVKPSMRGGKLRFKADEVIAWLFSDAATSK